MQRQRHLQRGKCVGSKPSIEQQLKWLGVIQTGSSTSDVRNPSTSIDTYAFIDSGSKSTLIHTDLSKQLGLTGNLNCLHVTTYDGNEKKMKAVKVKFTLFSRDQSAKLVVNGYSLDVLQIASNPTIDETTRQSWTHLNGLNFPHVGVDDVKVLIGADQIAAQHYDEYRMPPPSVHAPWAPKLPLIGVWQARRIHQQRGEDLWFVPGLPQKRSIIETWKR